MVSSEQRPEILLGIVQCTGNPSPQPPKMIQLNMSLVPRFGDPARGAQRFLSQSD